MAKKPRSKQQSSSTKTRDQDPSQPFVHRWNDLVSTTNWEKGRIICEWRAARQQDGAAANKISDEAWAHEVGSVTPQHVGRLRRVFERFGKVYDQYPKLFWSHFQVALDWEDAEMWLEGAVQNGWSVSQMRGQRWEALGAPDSLKPRDEDIIVAELDEDADVQLDAQNRLTPRTTAVRPIDDSSSKSRRGEDDADEAPRRPARESGAAATKAEPARARPFADIPPLPDDVAEAFEAFKLVILTHKMSGWTDISRDDLLTCLDALKELALQPAD